MTLLIVYLFSLDTLKHEQPDAWLVSQFLVLSLCVTCLTKFGMKQIQNAGKQVGLLR